jgi:CheY-like chemotaxis protein
MSAAQTRRAWLVEGDPTEAAFFARAFEDNGTWQPLVHFVEGGQALAHLRSRPAEKPTLILLAWNDRSEEALLFLGALKADETLRLIPVVVWAESNRESEVAESFARGAAAYVVKSRDPEELREEVATICAYWALSELPRL